MSTILSGRLASYPQLRLPSGNESEVLAKAAESRSPRVVCVKHMPNVMGNLKCSVTKCGGFTLRSILEVLDPCWVSGLRVFPKAL